MTLVHSADLTDSTKETGAHMNFQDAEKNASLLRGTGASAGVF